MDTMPLIMSGVRSVCRAPAVSKRLRPRASAPAPSAFSLARRHRHAYTHDTAMPTRRLPLRVGSTSHHLSHPHSSHTLAALSSHKLGGHRLAALPPHMLGGHRVGVSPAATGPVRSPVRSLFGFGKQSVLSATKVRASLHGRSSGTGLCSALHITAPIGCAACLRCLPVVPCSAIAVPYSDIAVPCSAMCAALAGHRGGVLFGSLSPRLPVLYPQFPIQNSHTIVKKGCTRAHQRTRFRRQNTNNK